jgi:hypothetical protein
VSFLRPRAEGVVVKEQAMKETVVERLRKRLGRGLTIDRRVHYFQ